MQDTALAQSKQRLRESGPALDTSVGQQVLLRTIIPITELCVRGELFPYDRSTSAVSKQSLEAQTHKLCS